MSLPPFVPSLRGRAFGLVSAAALLLAPALHAQGLATDPGAPGPLTLEMSRSTAMGGAHSAIASGNDALLVNPAGMSQTARWHLEVDGVLDHKFPAQGVIGTVVDAHEPSLAAGILFARWGSGQPEGRSEGWIGGLGYSTPLGSVLVGGVTKFVRFHTPDDEIIKKFAQDIGLLYRHGGVTTALVLQNISFKSIPLFPLISTVGLAYGSDADWRLAFDYKADLSDTQHVRHKVAAGGEMLVDQILPLRAGVTYDITGHLVWLSTGVGLVTEQGSLQIAYRRRVSGSSGSSTVLEAGITIFVR